MNESLFKPYFIKLISSTAKSMVVVEYLEYRPSQGNLDQVINHSLLSFGRHVALNEVLEITCPDLSDWLSVYLSACLFVCLSWPVSGF